jgi:subtilisin family serine protease
MNKVDDVGNGVYNSYSMTLTQADSTNIPSTNTFGDCDSASSFKVAIIDSGVQIKHKDLPCADTKKGTNCVGRTFGSLDPWWSPKDSWHGTHVMGIMAAKKGNSIGTTSVNPTLNNMCWIVGRVFDEVNGANGSYLSNIYKAVEWAVKSKGAKIVNMSLSAGYTETGQRVMEMVKNAGAIIVSAAGNSNTFQYEYPSSYDYGEFNVLSVGAVDSERYVFGVVLSVIGWTVRERQLHSSTYRLYLTLARFISFYISFWAPFSTCNRNVDISAPGVTIWGLDTQSRSQNGPYRTASGTSMAAAHVSGIIAKIWSQCPRCTDVQVTSCVKSSAADIGDYPWCYGAGLIQAEDAYKCLTAVCC